MSVSKRIVIAGGSGFIGKALSVALEAKGYEVVVLSRSIGAQARWDGESLAGDWAKFVDGAFAVVNLAGETVAQKWTLQAQQSIGASRIKSTRAVGEAICAAQVAPKVWINASATGYYGDRGEEILTEDSIPGNANEFLPGLSMQWEAEAKTANRPETRLALLRISVVLGKDGGAFLPLMKLAKAFLGGAPGSGKQWLSWIHRDDLVKMIIWAIENEEITGPYNAASPNPIRYNDFCQTMRQKLGRPFSPNVPAFFLQVGTLFGAPDASLLLESTRVLPERATKAGFEFTYPTVDKAIENLI